MPVGVRLKHVFDEGICKIPAGQVLPVNETHTVYGMKVPSGLLILTEAKGPAPVENWHVANGRSTRVKLIHSAQFANGQMEIVGFVRRAPLPACFGAVEIDKSSS